MTTQRDRLHVISGVKGFQKVNVWDRFFAKVDRRGADDCWMWTGARTGRGYGQFWLDGRHVPAHRVSYWLWYGDHIPAHLDGMHSCDTPLCVNPRHITPGTPTDNALDAKAKGRLVQPWGPQPICRNGHMRTDENTSRARNRQECLTCRRESNRRYWSEVRSKKAVPA